MAKKLCLNTTLNTSVILLLTVSFAACVSKPAQLDTTDASRAIELAKECIQMQSFERLGSATDLSAFRVSEVEKQNDEWKVSFKPLILFVPVNRSTPSNAIAYVSEKPSCKTEWVYLDNRGPHDKFEYVPLAETRSGGVINLTREQRMQKIASLQKAIEAVPAMKIIFDEMLSDSSDLTGSLLVLEREDHWFGHLFESPRWGASQEGDRKSYWFRFDPSTSKITDLPPRQN